VLKWHILSANTCLGASIFIKIFKLRSSSFSQSSQLLVLTNVQGFETEKMLLQMMKSVAIQQFQELFQQLKK
jgi:hypothetical protein